MRICQRRGNRNRPHRVLYRQHYGLEQPAHEKNQSCQWTAPTENAHTAQWNISQKLPVHHRKLLLGESINTIINTNIYILLVPVINPSLLGSTKEVNEIFCHSVEACLPVLGNNCKTEKENRLSKNKKSPLLEKAELFLKKVHMGILPALPLFSHSSAAVPSHNCSEGNVGPQSKLGLHTQVKKKKPNQTPKSETFLLCPTQYSSWMKPQSKLNNKMAKLSLYLECS